MSEIVIGRREFVTGAMTLALMPAFSGDGTPLATPLMLDAREGVKDAGPGQRLVFAVKGCPLRCIGCNVPESWEKESRMVRIQRLCVRTQTGKCPVGHCTGDEATCPTKALKLFGKPTTTDALVARALDCQRRDRAFRGVTLSGGEPLMFWQWAVELLRCLKDKGIATCLDTSLHAPAEAIAALLPHVDYWLADYKAHDEQLHRRFTGEANRLIRDNLERLVAAKVRLEVRCLVVPGLTDGDYRARHRYLKSLGLSDRQIVKVKYDESSRWKYQALSLKYPQVGKG